MRVGVRSKGRFLDWCQEGLWRYEVDGCGGIEEERGRGGDRSSLIVDYGDNRSYVDADLKRIVETQHFASLADGAPGMGDNYRVKVPNTPDSRKC
jgi:hypothetical protein